MVKTEHFRGKLWSGGEVLMEHIEGQLQSNARSAGLNGEWTGHFEFPDEKRAKLMDGLRYRLVLIDGRSGHIHIHIKGNDPMGRNLANFHGNGSVRH